MGKHLKILGLSLLALTAFMAVSASASQAAWLLLRDQESVLSLDLNVDVDLGELLAPLLGVEVHCNGGEGTIDADLNASHTVLSGSADITFHECYDLNFPPPVCLVHSPGQPDGLILASGTGVASMGPEGEVFVEAESNEFTNIEYLGEECPLTEIDGRVSGSGQVEVKNPLTDATLHALELTDQDLEFGSTPAEVHDGNLEPVTGSITEANGATFAVHLVGL